MRVVNFSLYAKGTAMQSGTANDLVHNVTQNIIISSKLYISSHTLRPKSSEV